MKAFAKIVSSKIVRVFLDKEKAFFNQQRTREQLATLFGDKLQIVLLDIENQNLVTEKFKIRGSPAFIFCKQGAREDVFLGTPGPDVLLEVAVRNLADSANI